MGLCFVKVFHHHCDQCLAPVRVEAPNFQPPTGGGGVDLPLSPGGFANGEKSCE